MSRVELAEDEVSKGLMRGTGGSVEGCNEGWSKGGGSVEGCN